MKTASLLISILFTSVCLGQEVKIKVLTPNQARLQETQSMAERIWEEQDRQKEKELAKISAKAEWYEFRKGTKTAFKGKFLAIEPGKDIGMHPATGKPVFSPALVIVQLENKKYLGFPVKALNSKDRVYIQGQLKERNKKPVVKKTVQKTVQ